MLAGLGRVVPPRMRRLLRRLGPARGADAADVAALRPRPRSAGDRRVRVHLGVNYFGAGNLGDDVMLAGFLAALGGRVERLALTCCTPYDRAAQTRRFPAITWLPDDPATRAQAIVDADAWLALGDTPFQLASGPWMRDHLLAQVDLVARRTLPMFYLGVGTEGEEVFADPRFRALAAAAEAIWCRDASSMRRLAPHAGGRIAAGADLAHAFLGDRASWPAWQGGPGEAGVDLALVIAFESAARFDAAPIAQAVGRAAHPTWLVQEVRDFPGTERHGWTRLPAATRRRLQLAVPDYAGAPDVTALLRAWPRAATVASSRYHALCIHAWRGSRLLAVQRSGKIAGAADDFALPHATLADLPEALADARPVAAERLEALAAASRAMVDDFCRVVGVAPVATPRGRGPAAPRIAVVKLDGLGDFVLATPFLRAVRQLWPAADVTLAVRPGVAALAARCPHVDRVVAVADPTADPEIGRCDLVFVPRASPDYFGGLATAARVPAVARWGFDGTSADLSALTHVVPPPGADTQARRNLHLLWAFTRQPLDDHLEVWPSVEAVAAWRSRADAAGAHAPRPFCLIGIGAGQAHKRWPAARWADVAAAVRDRHGLVPVLVGTADEQPLADAVLTREPQGVWNAVGGSADDLCALAGLARLFVGNDSGPKHVAAAGGAAVVEVNAYPADAHHLAESLPVYFRPHGVPHVVLQPDHGFTAAAITEGATVRSIAPARVLAAVELLLSSSQPAAVQDARAMD